MRPAPILTPQQLASIAAANLPTPQWPTRKPGAATFDMCEGTPNMLFTQELRSEVSSHLHKQGFQFRMYHNANGITLRTEQHLTPQHLQFVQVQLGPRYRVRMEAGRKYISIVISVAEWYTPTDISYALDTLQYPMRYSRVVKRDTCNRVEGLLLPYMNGMATDMRCGVLIGELEDVLARANVKTRVDIVYDRMRGARELYYIDVEGEWVGGGSMLPTFMEIG